MRKVLLTIGCFLAMAVPAQAAQNYNLDQVYRGTKGWINTFYPDLPADGFTRSGSYSCGSIGLGRRAKYFCDIELTWRNDVGNIVAKDVIALSERVRIKGTCSHKLYYMARKGQWRARVRIPVRYAANRGCILFRAVSPQFASRKDYL